MDEKRIEEILSYPILMAERARAAVDEAESFKAECGEVGKQVDRLAQMLRVLVRFTTSASQAVYERPVRVLAAEVTRNIERAVALVRKCKRRSILCRVVNITSATDFRKGLSLLEASIGDMRWLLSVFNCDGGSAAAGIVLSLPPIASNDPILAWVWSYIATVQMGQSSDRAEAANYLASLAMDNDRNKKIIVEEGGVPPLLKLFKETPSPDSQIAAAAALAALANDHDRVRSIVAEMGIPATVAVLADSPMRVQIHVAYLIARMAENDPTAQDDFARENVIRPLVTLVSFETSLDETNNNDNKSLIPSVIQMTKDIQSRKQVAHSRSHSWQNYRPYQNSYSNLSNGGIHRKEREKETPEVKLQLKTSCAEALWMLARNSVSNSKRISETKGLLCLAKLVEKEQGKLQYNCLMTIMEITSAAETNTDLRRGAFKTNSPAAKSVVDQLLRVMKELDSPTLQIPAIKSIGSLSRTFPARETRVISPLVAQLSNKHYEIATESAIALEKFACPENFLCIEHSKSIIELGAVPPLMRLLRGGTERAQLHSLLLLCYLAMHASNNQAFDRARVLNVVEGADRGLVSLHPQLKDLVPKAVYQLNLYHTAVNPQRQASYMP